MLAHADAWLDIADGPESVLAVVVEFWPTWRQMLPQYLRELT